MEGLDAAIAGWGEGGTLVLVLLTALALGLRHATDPDHVVAVSTLVAREPAGALGRAFGLGCYWGAGHGCTLLALGVPIVLGAGALPAGVQAAAELVVGLLIVVLALQVIVRWRRDRVHAHTHAHDGVVHRHAHTHAAAAGGHAHGHPHTHAHAHVRTPWQAFGLGLLHGVGGSAAVGVLLLASIDGRGARAGTLLVFAAGTVLSMIVVSSVLGYALGRSAPSPRLGALVPALGVAGAVFGGWYLVSASAGLS